MSGSLFITAVLKLYRLLNHWYEHSLIHKLSKRLASYCGGSLILGFFYRLIAVEGDRRYAEGSLLLKLFYKIGEILCSALENICRFARPLTEGSAILKVFKWEGLVMSCLRPEVALSLFVLFSAVVPAEYWSNFFILLAVILLAAIYTLQSPGVKPCKIPAALLLYLCFAFAGLFQSPAFSDSLRVIMIFAPCVCIALLIQNIIDTPEKLDFILGSILLGVFLTAIYSFYQYRAGIEVRADLVDLVASQGLRRAFSTMGNPNNYAEYLVLFLPVCFAFAMSRKTELQKLCAFALLAPGALALVLTSSRAGYLVIVGAAGLFILLMNKRLIPFFVLCFIGAIPFMPVSIINRVLTIGGDTSSKYRVMIWAASLQALQDFWVGGIGMGPAAFAKVYRIYSHPDAYNAMHAHNLFLQIWIENGIFAFIVFMIFFLGLLKKLLVNSLAPGTEAKMKAYMVSAICALVALGVFGMVEYVWFYPRVMLSFWVVAGLALAALRLNERRMG